MTSNLPQRSLPGRVFNKILSFLCAFVIAAAVYAAAGVFLTVDGRIKGALGDTTPMFSYSMVAPDKAELIAFGERFTIDYNALRALRLKAGELLAVNDNYTPEALRLCGALTAETFAGAARILGILPGALYDMYMGGA